ncbi:hypothetical protein DPMN_138648 [Dreissena polymorpha]|uniref:Sushi domain-containing protein n=1 Tax=Dreissena polymorpha TaxID=45954 RepID=A0A9D4JIS4_DREPO|nr:hypothetical protein DPMN_138648 [Dreissena polymorpha]
MCPEFNLPPNTTSLESRVNKTFGNVISYKCKVGFEMAGNQSSVECQANKTWTKGSECQIVRCQEFVLPPNTTSNESRINRTFGDVVSYTCQVGFERTGNESSVQCQANKTWTQWSECQIVRCPEFVLPPNTTSNESRINRTFGDMVSYTCQDGFEMTGKESSVKCQANKTWTQGSGCQIVRCPEFVLPPNTTSNESRINRTFGDVISYTCQDGFEMTGTDSSVKCHANKTWSQGSLCRPTMCVAFDLPPNTTSKDTLTNRTLGESVSYSCVEGFELNGNESTVKCQANKSWTKGSDCLRVYCPEFNLPSNTTSLESRVNKTFGDVISYTCKVGFEMAGNQSSVQCQANKTWTKGSECQIVRCQEFVLPPNTTSNEPRINRTFGDVLSYTCQDGFEMPGNESSVKCQANKTWSHGSECRIFKCVAFDLSPNATSKDTLTNRTLGESVSYTCIEGFELNGNESTVKCQTNKTWTKGSECVPVKCSEFSLPSNATSGESRINRTFGDVISYTCNIGFELAGTESIVKCQANKTWSKGSECRHVQCITFQLPPNTTSSDILTNRTLGESVSYKCIEGFELNGNASTVKCQENKTWTNGSICVRVICPEFNLPPNSTSLESRVNKTFGDMLFYSCQVGFEMVGNESSVKCQANKTWTQGSGCQIVRCPEFVLLPNSTSNESRINRTFGDVISYTCQVGFEITENEPSVKCQANKTWSQGFQCRPIQCIPFQLPTNTTSNDIFTNRTLGESVSYTCIEGFELNGNDSTVKCLENKTWTKGSDCLRVKCPEFLLLQNSTSNESRINRTFGDVISYTCQAGFEMTGNESSVRCQANETWSQGSECRPIRCPEFFLPLNSIFNGSRLNRTFGEVIAYTCQPGYEMAGNDSSVVCQANKTWSRGLECLPVQCPAMSVPPYSTANSSLTNRTYGATVMYSCQTGYELNGNISSMICQANRSWSHSSSCEPVQCQVFKFPNNSIPGQPITENSTFPYGTNISLSCIEGYEGGGLVTCLANKSWSFAELCIPKRCVAYDYPAYASLIENTRTDNLTFGEIINITCNPGYLSNNKTAVTVYCSANGTWLPIIKCEPRPCPNFTAPANSTIGNQVLFGRVYKQTINVTCNDSFNQVGNTEVICGEDGTWSPSPSCIQCSGLNIPNATVLYQTSTNASISCIQGFNLNGPAIVFCQDDGNWTEAPRCVPVNCSNPSDPPYGTLNYTSTLLGARAYLTCGDGFQLNGRAYLECAVDGGWNQSGTCEPRDCGNFSMPEHSTVVANDGTKVNATVMFNCTERFTLATNSSNTLTCSSNGSWIGYVDCVSKVCEMFSTPNHSILLNTTTSGLVVGITLIIECKLGYSLQGSDRITCLPNSSWTPIPQCKPIDCGVLQDPDNGFANVGNTTWGSNVTLECDEGFKFVGSNRSTCETTGNWSRHGRCEIVDCYNYTVPNNCNVSKSYATTFNSTITVNGINGYVISKNSTGEVVCDANGLWSGYVACVRNECGMFQVPANATILNSTSQKYYFGDGVIVNCTKGFVSENDGIVKCLANGTWTALPTCTRINCGEFKVLPNGIINGSSTFVDSVVLVGCTEGYNLIGSNTSTCLATGNWSQHGTCQMVDCGNYTVPDNCTIHGSYNTTFNSSVRVAGIEGFKLANNDSGQIVCAANGTWSRYVACVRKECTTFVAPPYAEQKNASVYFYGDNINITCLMGYTLVGNAVVRCQADGNWTQIPTCTKAACNPIIIEHANISFNQDYSNATVACFDNYAVVGSSQLTCQSNGNWTDIPSCNLTHCPKLPLPDNGVLNSSKSEIGTSVSMNCTTGYEPDGDSIITCLRNGSWSSNITCTPVDCGKYDEGNNRKFTLTNGTTTFNSSREVTCAAGLAHTADSATSVICAANGSWVGTPNCSIPGN